MGQSGCTSVITEDLKHTVNAHIHSKQAMCYRWWASWSFPMFRDLSSMRLPQFNNYDTERLVPDGFQACSEIADATTTPFRAQVPGSGDAILSKVGWTMAVSGGSISLTMEEHQGTALGPLLMVLPGNVSLGVWSAEKGQDWKLSSHKGRQRFYDQSLPQGSIVILVLLQFAGDECRRALISG